MRSVIDGVGVKAISAAVPGEERGYADLLRITSEKEAQRICASTGINSIRVSSEGQTAADLCEVAARKIIDKTDKNRIVGLVFVSQTPDYIMPATSCVLQHRLELSSDIVCYDVNAGCTGFVKGLHLASMIASSARGDVLLLAGDTMSKHVSPLDHSLYLLMGDAGSAALITPQDGKSIIFNMKTFGDGYESLIIPAGGSREPISSATGIMKERENGNSRSDEHLYMDGMGIMVFALTKAAPLIKQELKALDREPDTILVHQANKFIVESIVKNLKLAPERVPIAVDGYGNTGQCTIPIDVCHCFNNKRRPGYSLMAAFGVGLTAATAALDLSDVEIYPVTEI